MAIIKKDGIRIKVDDNIKLESISEELGIPLGCYIGKCGICKIEIVSGMENLTFLTPEEKKMNLEKNERLTCMCKIKNGEIKIK